LAEESTGGVRDRAEATRDDRDDQRMGLLGGPDPDRDVERPLRHGYRYQHADPPRARRGRVAIAADPGRVPVIAVATVL
jgi:hypothetical protein